MESLIVTIKKNRKIIAALFSIILFFQLWANNIYFSIKNARITDIISVKIEGLSEDELWAVKVFRLTPLTDALVEIKRTKNIWSSGKYFKKIRISLPVSGVDKIKQIQIQIGNKNLYFTKEDLLNQWIKVESASNYITLENPKSIRGNHPSILKQFKNIINWPGDSIIIWKSLNFVALTLILLFIIWLYIPQSFMARLLDNSTFKITVFAFFILLALSASINTLYHNGLFNLESDLYLTHYLSDKPIFQKVFDCMGGDTHYRGRELSYLFNYLDSQLILISMKLGFPHFLSGIYYLCLTLIAILHLFFSNKYLSKKMFWVSFLLLMVYLTSPTPFLSGSYFRTTKIIISLGLLLALWLLYIKFNVKEDQKLNSHSQFIKPFFLTLLVVGPLPLLDETGVAFVGLLWIFLVTNYILNRQKGILPLIWGCSLALFFAFFYRNILGPWLVFKATGVRHSLWNLAGIFPIDIENLDNSFLLFFQYIGMFFGNIGALFASFIFAALFWISRLSYYNVDQTPRDIDGSYGFTRYIKRSTASDGLLIMGSLAIISVIYLMTKQHPPLLWPDLKLFNYALPVVTIFLFAVNLELNKLLILRPHCLGAVTVFLWLILILNINALSEHNYTVTNSKTKEFYYQAPKVINAILTPDIPVEQFNLLNGNNTVKTIRKHLYKTD